MSRRSLAQWRPRKVAWVQLGCCRRHCPFQHVMLTLGGHDQWIEFHVNTFISKDGRRHRPAAVPALVSSLIYHHSVVLTRFDLSLDFSSCSCCSLWWILERGLISIHRRTVRHQECGKFERLTHTVGICSGIKCLFYGRRLPFLNSFYSAERCERNL